MEWALLGLLIVFLLLALAGSSHKSPSWSVRQVESDESSVQYRDGTGKLHREREGCNGCVQILAEELQRKGFEVVEVEVGRRNSGDL